MEIIRSWKNGKEDIFPILELQNKILSPISKPFEPKEYKPIEIIGIPLFYNYDIKELPGEYFEYLEKKDLYISNFGRIKNEDKIEPQIKRGNPQKLLTQPTWYVDIQKKYKGYVYPLVAEVFYKKLSYDCEIHHINGNALDNRAGNLIYVTRKQHSEIEPSFEILNRQIFQEMKYLNWENNLLYFEPGVNIINIIDIKLLEDNIFTDFYHKVFKFYNAEISYDYYVGGSKDKIKGSKTIRSGIGEFNCMGSKIKSIIINKID